MVASLVMELNRVHALFMQHNPDYKAPLPTLFQSHANSCLKDMQPKCTTCNPYMYQLIVSSQVAAVLHTLDSLWLVPTHHSWFLAFVYWITLNVFGCVRHIFDTYLTQILNAEASPTCASCPCLAVHALAIHTLAIHAKLTHPRFGSAHH